MLGIFILVFRAINFFFVSWGSQFLDWPIYWSYFVAVIVTTSLGLLGAKKTWWILLLTSLFFLINLSVGFIGLSAEITLKNRCRDIYNRYPTMLQQECNQAQNDFNELGVAFESLLQSEDHLYGGKGRFYTLVTQIKKKYLMPNQYPICDAITPFISTDRWGFILNMIQRAGKRKEFSCDSFAPKQFLQLRSDVASLHETTIATYHTLSAVCGNIEQVYASMNRTHILKGTTFFEKCASIERASEVQGIASVKIGDLKGLFYELNKYFRAAFKDYHSNTNWLTIFFPVIFLLFLLLQYRSARKLFSLFHRLRWNKTSVSIIEKSKNFSLKELKKVPALLQMSSIPKKDILSDDKESLLFPFDHLLTSEVLLYNRKTQRYMFDSDFNKMGLCDKIQKVLDKNDNPLMLGKLLNKMTKEGMDREGKLTTIKNFNTLRNKLSQKEIDNNAISIAKLHLESAKSYSHLGDFAQVNTHVNFLKAIVHSAKTVELKRQRTPFLMEAITIEANAMADNYNLSQAVNIIEAGLAENYKEANKDASYFKALSTKGHILTLLGEYKKAGISLQEAYENIDEPEKIQSGIHLVKAMAMSGKHDNAAALYKEIDDLCTLKQDIYSRSQKSLEFLRIAGCELVLTAKNRERTYEILDKLPPAFDVKNVVVANKYHNLIFRHYKYLIDFSITQKYSQEMETFYTTLFPEIIDKKRTKKVKVDLIRLIAFGMLSTYLHILYKSNQHTKYLTTIKEYFFNEAVRTDNPAIVAVYEKYKSIILNENMPFQDEAQLQKLLTDCLYLLPNITFIIK